MAREVGEPTTLRTTMGSVLMWIGLAIALASGALWLSGAAAVCGVEEISLEAISLRACKAFSMVLSSATDLTPLNKDEASNIYALSASLNALAGACSVAASLITAIGALLKGD